MNATRNHMESAARGTHQKEAPLATEARCIMIEHENGKEKETDEERKIEMETDRNRQKTQR